MLAKQPALFAYCPDKEKLLDADSALWVELLIKQPGFAEIYPMKDLDKVDEVEHLLRHRPELTGRLSWDKDNPPVKLFIANGKPELMTFSPELAWFKNTTARLQGGALPGRKTFFRTCTPGERALQGAFAWG